MFPEDYEVWIPHFDDYVLGIETYGSSIWQEIKEGTQIYSKMKKEVLTQDDFESIIADDKQVDSVKKEKLINNLKALRIIRLVIPPNHLLVSSYKYAKETWDRLKELYSGDADLTHSLQTSLLSKFGYFKKKYDESIEQIINRFNHLLSHILKHNL